MKIASRALAVATALLILAGCSAGASSTPTPISSAAAVTAVLAQDARFTGITALDPNAIGQSAWYEVAPATGGGYVVRVTIGWGDCPAGCINRHVWQYAVTSTGAVSLTAESGDPLPVATTGLAGTLTSGPTCPVVSEPPDPACADKPVAGAIIVVTDASGAVTARVTSGADGTYSLTAGPGVYTLTPQPFDGLMGTAPPQTVRLEIGGGMATVDFSYDTGIR
jgi:hypothetical protein